MKTPQEIFNTVVTHLRTQNEKAFPNEKANYGCAYRTTSGKTCAVGCLIPAEKYDFRMEGASLTKLSSAKAVTRTMNDWSMENEETNDDGPYSRLILATALQSEDVDMNDDATINLLQNMQQIHDKYDVKDWEARFAKAAVDNNLTLLPKN